MSPREPAQEELISRRQAARIAGVHVNTIRQWEKTGKLHPRRVRVGRREEVRISSRELDEALSERAGGWGPATPAWTLTREGLWQLVEEAREQAQEAKRFSDDLEQENRILRMQLETLKIERESGGSSARPRWSRRKED